MIMVLILFFSFLGALGKALEGCIFAKRDSAADDDSKEHGDSARLDSADNAEEADEENE